MRANDGAISSKMRCKNTSQLQQLSPLASAEHLNSIKVSFYFGGHYART